MIFINLVEANHNESKLVCGTPPLPPSDSGLVLYDFPEQICPGLKVTYKCDVGGVNKFLVSKNVRILNSIKLKFFWLT